MSGYFPRVRVRSDARNVVATRIIKRPDGSIYETQHPTLIQMNWHEIFKDCVSNHHGEIHRCYHSKLMISPHQRPSITVNSEGWSEVNSDYWLYNDPDTILTWFPGPTDADKARLAEEAFNAFLVQMPQEVSIPNFVWELRELQDMIPKIEEGLTKTVAGGYLTYSFGYAPFVSDVTKLRNLSKTVADRLAYLRRTFGRETRVSYRGTFSVPAQDVTSSDYRRKRPEYTGVFRSGGYLYHELKELYGPESTIRGFAAALGLNNPVGVLWEAVPYSFVADWFTKTKSIVNHLAVQPYTGVWEVRRLTHSFTWEGVWYDSQIYPDTTAVPREWPYTEGVAKLYNREPGLPVSTGFLTQYGLNTRQQMLAAALLASSSR